MPLIRTIRPQMFAAKPLPDLPSGDDVTGDFPVVVVVDSGISDEVPGLESWVVGRDVSSRTGIQKYRPRYVRGRSDLLGRPAQSHYRRTRRQPVRRVRSSGDSERRSRERGNARPSGIRVSGVAGRLRFSSMPMRTRSGIFLLAPTSFARLMSFPRWPKNSTICRKNTRSRS